MVFDAFGKGKSANRLRFSASISTNKFIFWRIFDKNVLQYWNMKHVLSNARKQKNIVRTDDEACVLRLQ